LLHNPIIDRTEPPQSQTHPHPDIPTTGTYLNSAALLHFGAGLIYDSLYGYSIASIVMLTTDINYMLGVDNTFGQSTFNLIMLIGRTLYNLELLLVPAVSLQGLNEQ
jgi:hypothetical protein